MKKKQANPESKIGYVEFEDGSLDWTTPNFDLHIRPAVGRIGKYEVYVFDSRISDDEEAFVEGQEFDFWWEVLEYLEGWN